VKQIAYSPEGNRVAAVHSSRPTPLFFDGRTGEEVMPYEGHGNWICDLRFSADGRTLRSVGWDGTVCTWDAATMKMLRRISLPAGRVPIEIRPSDGRYAFCPSAADPKLPVLVFDLENAKDCCEVPLPVKAEWTDSSEAEDLYSLR